jgi:hypothetical protein
LTNYLHELIEILLIITLNIGHDTWRFCVQLKKQQKMMMSPNPGPSSSFALEEKNQKIMTSQYGPPPPSKNKIKDFFLSKKIMLLPILKC